jgi:hypothetical protein
MAEQRRTKSQNGSRSSRSNGSQAESRSSSGGAASRQKVSARDAVLSAREEFPSLLGRPVESVLGVLRDDDDGWQVMVQVVELARIPHSTDVLGAYVVNVDEDGELTGYQRRRRYIRSQADED